MDKIAGNLLDLPIITEGNSHSAQTMCTPNQNRAKPVESFAKQPLLCLAISVCKDNLNLETKQFFHAFHFVPSLQPKTTRPQSCS
jgi:hypothetical protein